MQWKSLQSAIAILAVVTGEGCNYSTAPRPLGTFVLVTVGGEGLPTSTMTRPGETVLADTLVAFGVSRGGVGRVEQHETNQYGSGINHVVYSLNYLLKDGAWVFQPPPCPADADCAFVERTGQLDGDVLTVTFRDAEFRTRIYRRVS